MHDGHLGRPDAAGGMIFVIGYLLAFVAILGSLWTFEIRGLLPLWIAPYLLVYNCVLMGGFGGVVYCLRAVYLNRSVRNRWDANWTVWYLLRPLVSCLVGGATYVFLRAGLLVLEAEQASDSGAFGFLALAFVAGFNVDRFLARIEEIAQSAWGIRPSRTYEDGHKVTPVQRSDETGTGR